MSFSDQTSSFFDELSRIIDEKQKARDKSMTEQGGARPFSSMLTQDEEPTQEYNSADQEIEPEVVTRR